MKKAFTKVWSIVILVLMVLSLAGCGQMTRLQSLLPGAQTEAAVAESSGEEAGPVSGDISELQNSLSWVYLIEESAGKDQSPTGILVYNPSLSGHSMSGVTGTQAYIEWDGREFDLEAKASSAAEGWYYSAQLATNIRNQQYVLRVYLLNEYDEAEEIRLENPKIALLEWPSLTDKSGIRMEKSGDSYTFSAKTIRDLFQEKVPGIFHYRIKDCTDCNVQLEGDTIQYKSVSSGNASFIVEISDPAGGTKEVEVGIVRSFKLPSFLLPAAVAAVLVIAAAALLIRRKIRKDTEEKSLKVSEAQKAILKVVNEAEGLMLQCRSLAKNANAAREDALRQYDTYRGGIISREVIEDAVEEAESITNSPYFETIRIEVSDLQLMSSMLESGKKEALHHQNWTRELFIDEGKRSKELDKIRKNIAELKKEFKRANTKMNNLDPYTNPGKDPFSFALDIHVNTGDTKWTCTIKNGAAGVQKLGSLYYRSPGKKITGGKEILGSMAAGVQIFTLDEDTVLLLSERGTLLENGVKNAEGENSIWLRRGESVSFTVGEQEEMIEIRTESL